MLTTTNNCFTEKKNVVLAAPADESFSYIHTHVCPCWLPIRETNKKTNAKQNTEKAE